MTASGKRPSIPTKIAYAFFILSLLLQLGGVVYGVCMSITANDPWRGAGLLYDAFGSAVFVAGAETCLFFDMCSCQAHERKNGLRVDVGLLFLCFAIAHAPDRYTIACGDGILRPQMLLMYLQFALYVLMSLALLQNSWLLGLLGWIVVFATELLALAVYTHVSRIGVIDDVVPLVALARMLDGVGLLFALIGIRKPLPEAPALS